MHTEITLNRAMAMDQASLTTCYAGAKRNLYLQLGAESADCQMLETYWAEAVDSLCQAFGSSLASRVDTPEGCCLRLARQLPQPVAATVQSRAFGYVADLIAARWLLLAQPAGELDASSLALAQALEKSAAAALAYLASAAAHPSRRSLPPL